MLEHAYHEVKLRGKNQTKRRLVIEFEEGYELLSVFLESEVTNFYDPVRKELEAVLSGEKENGEFHGNHCRLSVMGDLSILWDDTAEDEIGNWCQLDSTDLLELVEEWKEKNDAFRQKQKEIEEKEKAE